MIDPFEHIPDADRQPDAKYIVRLYDAYEHNWIDISHKPLTEEEARAVWMEHTQNGTKNIRYSDGAYYAIFPFETRMIFSNY